MRILRLIATVLMVAAGLTAAKANDAVTVGLQLEPPGLDPTRSIDSAIGEIVYKNVFEGLTWAAPDGTVKPLLATDWTVSPDGRHYTFRLRRGVRFHDGSPFDADTVRFVLARAVAKGSLNPQKDALAGIAAVRGLDPYTVRIDLAAPDSALPFVLALPALAMVSPTSAAGNALRPVGTGPFRFAEWRRGAWVRLTRNDDYWGLKASLRQATFKFIADAGGAFAAVSAGDVDLFPDYPAPENIAAFRADPKLVVEIGTTEGQVLLAINNRQPPFDQVLVRRAVSYALNRRDIINGAFYGFGTPIGSHYAPQDEGYVDLTGMYPYDPAKARALLAQAGFPHGFDVTLKLPPPPYARRSGEIVAAELAAVGIRAKIETVEWARWLSEVFTDHAYDLTVINHIEPMDYDIYGKPGYYFGYDSAYYRALLARLKTATSPQARLALLQALQYRLAADAVNGFLFELPRLTVHKKTLTGYPRAAMIASNDLSRVRFADASATGAAGNGGRWGAAGLLLIVLLATILTVRRAGLFYVSGRIGQLALTVLVSSAVIFFVLQGLPGDPASFMLGTGATPESLAALRAELGLDAPLWQRYVHWIGGISHGDLGLSYTYRVPVLQLLRERLSVSVPLTLLAMAFAVAIALPLGVLSAWGRARGKRGWNVLTSLGIAIPDFWLGIVLVLIFSTGLHLLPAGGFPGWGAGFPALASLLLPALALAVPQGAILARVLSNALSEALAADYIRTARAKGLSAGMALVRHALPNALVPVLTVLGMQFAFLIAGAIIVENVFSLPGLGHLVSQAVVQRDLIVVQGASLVLVAATAGASFLVDIAYGLADPRIGAQNGGRS